MRINHSSIFRSLCFLWIVLLLAIFLPVKTVTGQVKNPDIIKSRFEQYRKNDLQEKLFVHVNKTFYVAGEILWFKIYDINGATNKPFDFSKVAYVELLNKDNLPVIQTKVSLNQAGGGSIELPFSLHSGSYTFRAYTSWMKNFSPDFYFHKKIRIVNTTKGNDLPATDSTLRYDIQFFPEGGNLVNGLQSVIAFKMTDEYGKGVDFIGTVIDQNKDTLLHFKPFKFGMGHFSFTPRPKSLYTAVIKTSNGKTIVDDLPVAYDEGYVMHVKAEDNKVKITVHTNIPSADNAYLLIHTRGSVKVVEALSLTNGEADLEIDRNKFGDGISQITLFNNKKQPVCERLFFEPVKGKLNIQLNTSELQYPSREKVDLTWNTSDGNGKNVSASLSVSVYKLDQLQTIDHEDILNYLWLSSDLTGYIEHPEFYFKAKSDSGHEAVSNLMMTQGWRRFDWEKVLKENKPGFQYAPEMEGPVISGMVTDLKTHSPVSDALAYLAIPGKQVQLYASESNDAGMVYFNMKHFYGHNQIVVRSNSRSKDSLDEIVILSPFSEKYLSKGMLPFAITPDLKSLLHAHNLWMQTAHAYHKAERERWKQYVVDTTAFYGKPYKTYLLDNYTRYVTMEEVLREYVMEVAVRKEKKHFHLKVMNALFDFDQSLSAMLFNDDPLALFDGVPVFDMDKIIAFDPLKVQKIEVIAGRYFYGPVIADGIVSFTTYKGNLEDYALDPRAVVPDYEGLQRERIFYDPSGERMPASIPDFRNVLYWSPDIETNRKGEAECSFYTSDLPGKYVILVNGITKDGLAGSNAFTFEVTK